MVLCTVYRGGIYINSIQNLLHDGTQKAYTWYTGVTRVPTGCTLGVPGYLPVNTLGLPGYLPVYTLGVPGCLPVNTLGFPRHLLVYTLGVPGYLPVHTLG